MHEPEMRYEGKRRSPKVMVKEKGSIKSLDGYETSLADNTILFSLCVRKVRIVKCAIASKLQERLAKYIPNTDPREVRERENWGCCYCGSENSQGRE